MKHDEAEASNGLDLDHVRGNASPHFPVKGAVVLGVLVLLFAGVGLAIWRGAQPTNSTHACIGFGLEGPAAPTAREALDGYLSQASQDRIPASVWTKSTSTTDSHGDAEVDFTASETPGRRSIVSVYRHPGAQWFAGASQSCD